MRINLRLSVVWLMVWLVLCCCAIVPALADPIEALQGDWECIALTEDAEDFIFILQFTAPGEVSYVAGWYESEIAASYQGQYSIEGDTLKLEMTDTESEDTLCGTFTYSLDEGKLVLTKESGDSLSWLYDTGIPMEFTARHSQ